MARARIALTGRTFSGSLLVVIMNTRPREITKKNSSIAGTSEMAWPVCTSTRGAMAVACWESSASQ